MSYYWFNRQGSLQKAKDWYHDCGVKEKAAECYLKNKDFIKEKANDKYKNLSEEKEAKKKKKKNRKNRYKNMEKAKIFLYNIKMSEKTLKFDNVEVNKKEFDASKQAIDLNLVDTDKVLTSDKFKHSDNDFKYFIGYKEDNIIRPLSIVLPQMSGYITYFEAGGKNVF